ncbi:MAG: tyrosine-type recombinase/integrase, partial [Planctomycetota bacterium]
CRTILKGCEFRFTGDLAASKVQNFLAVLRVRKKTRKVSPEEAAKAPPAPPPPMISAQTRAFYLVAFKAFCRWLVLDRRMIDNPEAHLQPRTAAADRRHDRAALTPEELARLIAAARASGDERTVLALTGSDRAMLYLVAAFTGLRAAELASLTPTSFDFEAGQPTLTVKAAYSKHEKTDVLPLHPDLVAALPEWLAERPVDERLWPSRWHTNAAVMMRADLAAAEIPYETQDGRFRDFHALRHTHGTLLGGANVPLRDHMRLMRHCDPRLTMRYCHAELVDQARSLGKLPSLPAAKASTPCLSDPTVCRQSRIVFRT